MGQRLRLLSAHYRFAPGEGEFWESMRDVNEERLAGYVENYDENGFCSFEKFDGGRMEFFGHYLFYQLLLSMGVESDFYESLDLDVRSEVKDRIDRTDEQITSRVDRHLTYEDVYGENGLFT